MSTPVPRRTVLCTATTDVVVVATGATVSCSLPGGSWDGECDRTGEGPHEVTVRAAAAAVVVDPAEAAPGEVTARASRALLDRATAVVVSSSDDADVRDGAAAARHLGIPLIVAGPVLAAELDRLGTRTVLRYAAHAPKVSASPTAAPVPTEFGDREVVEGTSVADLPDLPGLPLKRPAAGATVLVLHGTSLPVALKPLLHAVGTDPVVVAAPRPPLVEGRPGGPAVPPGGAGPRRRSRFRGRRGARPAGAHHDPGARAARRWTPPLPGPDDDRALWSSADRGPRHAR